MKDITLQQLLEAGCHFGHKSERRNPKASSYIYTEKDGIHIIDLAQTKAGLDAAREYIKNVVADGGNILFVGTKRQAKDILSTECSRVNAPFIVERWIGGFLTNWEGIQKTIKKIITMTEDEKNGGWKKFPKHEQVKMSHHLKRLNMFYGGVVSLTAPPTAMFIVDIKKEGVAFKEALRTNTPIVAMVDTNVNPTDVSYQIPANDDAVGSISIIMKALTDAYEEGKRIFDRNQQAAAEAPKTEKKQEEEKVKKEEKDAEKPKEEKTEEKKTEKAKPAKKAKTTK